MKFDHNGIGKLADAQSCTVTEKRNGSYELKLICPADGIHAEMLEEGNIILAKPSDTMQSQPFRIYKITTPIDGKLEVQARHISYQLNFITVSPFSVVGCVGAMQGLKSHAASDCPFEVWTDVESSATFTLGVPSSFRNCLGGMAGSVLDVFGGEFEWDRYTVKFHKARGADHNVHIIYGKNLTDFKMEKSIENTITGVHPYWVDNETQAVMELPEKVVLQSKRSIPYQKITVLDCTSNFQEKPSEAALREYAQNYIDTTDSVSYTHLDVYKRQVLARGLLNTRMRDFYDIKTLLSIYEQDIDADVLKKAFEATCKKRSTENLKEEAPKIMAAVSDDAQLHTLWKSYQKKYPYAADISYEDIMESTMLLWSKIQ